ncbi:MAG: carboxymuconolactone decarboxylase family protein [Pseudomonadota bacterium]
MANKLNPLKPPYPPEIEQALAAYPQQDGYILSLFRTFANSVRFLKKGVPNLLDRDSPLNLITREIVILRTTANRNCEYEWGIHVSVFSNAAHLSEDQVRATRLGGSDCWSDNELRLIAVVDELCARGELDSETLVHFQTDWSLEQQLEIMALIGTYSTISYVANVAQLPLEAFAASFPYPD